MNNDGTFSVRFTTWTETKPGAPRKDNYVGPTGQEQNIIGLYTLLKSTPIRISQADSYSHEPGTFSQARRKAHPNMWEAADRLGIHPNTLQAILSDWQKQGHVTVVEGRYELDPDFIPEAVAKTAYDKCLRAIERKPIYEPELENLARSLSLPLEHVKQIFSLLVKEKKAVEVQGNFYGTPSHGYALRKETQPNPVVQMPWHKWQD